MYTHVNSSFSIRKWGVRGSHSLPDKKVIKDISGKIPKIFLNSLENEDENMTISEFLEYRS